MADVERPWMARARPEHAYRMRAFLNVGGRWMDHRLQPRLTANKDWITPVTENSKHKRPLHSLPDPLTRTQDPGFPPLGEKEGQGYIQGESLAALTQHPAGGLPQTHVDTLLHYLKASTSENTRKSYRSALRQFEKWGGRLPTERDTLMRYLLDKAAQVNPRTLDLHVTAISQWHRYQGLEDPARDPWIRQTLDGIRRVHGTAKKKAKALRLEHIVDIMQHLQALPVTRKQRRDSALVLTGFFGAFRRSELVAIRIEDLIWEPEGLLIRIPRSKTDQQAAGQVRALPYGKPDICPGSAIKAWLAAAGLTTGPLFRAVNRHDHVMPTALNPGSVNRLLKTLGSDCQFDFTSELSSHSLRRGMSTSAARARIEFEWIKKQGGWKKDTTVWEYIEEGQQFADNAAARLMDKMAELIEPKTPG